MTNQSTTPAAVSVPSTLAADSDIEILPALPAGKEWLGVPEDITLPKQLEFEPVLLRGGRGQVTAMKQRAFIRVLAETGRVSLAAKATGNTLAAFYYLRNQPQGKSFARAWARALDFGVGRVLDILVDHAMNGTPEYIYQNGELVGERRRFDHRLMMWLVAHNQPEKYAVSGGLMHAVNEGAAGAARMKRLKKEWELEYQAKRSKWHKPVDVEAVKAEIIRKAELMQRPEMIQIANDPKKRAAWELLNGPRDWSEFERYQHR
ncbi:hypothetical protein EUU23_01985 [Sphingorhabdus sp. IMCC26285]|uniref:Uncharacterized protein n=1 Tax=Sphingorhabdus profundilacus TaxID=2509718 RepID=A0A6I4LSS1_9SPHN|nr:hypothetical protein [Sphingorhabdus profundilacus]MVZ96472.1 hypothetical protein [Sphingorhabdus profundilacus]